PPTRLHKVWFGVVFALGVVYLFALPPYQGNDEWPHWVRTWTIAQGELRCGDIPKSALVMAQDFPFHADRGDVGKLRLENFRASLAGTPESEPFGARNTSACGYWPLAYVVPAILVSVIARGGDGNPTQLGMLLGFYASRLAGWAIMSACVWWAVGALAWA